jgi:trigger factor
MRINKSIISDTEVKLTITADEAFMAKTKEHVLKHKVQEMKLPGFRPGKAPLALVEKQVDPNVMQSDFLDEAVNRLYSEAMKAEGLRAVANPTVNLKKFVPYTDLEFEATVEVLGEAKIADYKKIKKALKPLPVTAEDIAGVIKTLQIRLAEKTEVDRAAKDGDEVVMDFEGTDAKGVAINGADAKDYPMIIGSNSLIPGFEPNLIGMKAGSEKSFDVTFPSDYQSTALAGKKATFKVKVHKVNELRQPKVDDELAAKSGPFKTLKELKEDIKKQLAFERENEARKTLENELVSEIAKKSKLAVPKTLIDDQIQRNEDEERRNLAYRGQTWQEHLKEDGVTEEEHRDRNRPAAEESIKAGLVLAEIAELENITFTPEEVDLRIELLKGQYTDPDMRNQLDKPENRRDIEGRIMTEKTIEALVKYASAK